MEQLRIIKNYLRVIFFEDDECNIQVHVIYKAKARRVVCNREVILKFTITQEKVLELMKKHQREVRNAPPSKKKSRYVFLEIVK